MLRARSARARAGRGPRRARPADRTRRRTPPPSARRAGRRPHLARRAAAPGHPGTRRDARVTAVTAPLVLRPAVEADAARLADIWNREVLETLATTDTEPRTTGVLRAWLTQRTAAYPVVVAEVDRDIAGFAALTPYPPKPAFHQTVEDSIYVDRGWRGRRV